MFEAKIVVELPGIAEALNNLANAIAGNAQLTVRPNNENVTEDVTATKESVITPQIQPPVSSTAIPPVTAPAVVSTTVVPPQTSPQMPTTAPAATEAAKTYTANEISNAGAALIDAGKMPALIALLSTFGVQAVPQLKPEQYPAFVHELRQLGANI